MEIIKNYKSYNDNKSIDELQYNLSLEIDTLENMKLELAFYNHLLDKPIFKEHTINLYERLSDLKHEIQELNTKRIDLLNAIYSHSNHINIKIECDDIACDTFFIKEHDAIELKIFNFNRTVANFKYNLFQYLDSVLIN
ncbi:hypothetical protein [Aestuariivivens sediminis]|uniref:hypothetical protein n=1 Tax=Aestuariivivens sediminis TaxID=2913557 RepID=UPI001F573CB7|nr:hypothetical protein [Aestuariivivens sediminis]